MIKLGKFWIRYKKLKFISHEANSCISTVLFVLARKAVPKYPHSLIRLLRKTEAKELIEKIQFYFS